MTAKDQNGKVIHKERREYDNWNFWIKGRSKEVPFKYWDITKTVNVNQGLIPGKTDEDTYVIFVDKDTKSVTIEATFLFEHEREHWEKIKTVTKTVDFTE